MNDYIALRIEYTPHSEDANDLLAAYLADEGYESFESIPEGLLAYIPSASFSEASHKHIISDFPMDVTFTKVETEEIKGKDWNEEWEKNYFKPIVIGEECVVHSSFHTDVPEAEYDIVIDPKMAFGTGHHATTSMMIRHLLNAGLNGKIRGMSIIDMGTGTGILAILASKLGAEKIDAVEIDPAACVNARENVELNSCKNICVHEGDSSVLQSLGKADIFLANINRNVILADLGRYAAAMKPGAEMFLSGFYQSDISILQRAAQLYGLTVTSQLVDNDDWSSIVLKTL